LEFTGASVTEAEQHFTTRADGTPAAPGRYVDVASIEAAEFLPGLQFRPVLGERTMLNFVSFEPNTEAPMHVHEEEQIVLVIEGEFEFEIDGDIRTMQVGDVAVVPSWVPHGARTHDTSCREVDVFNPPRRSLVDHARGQAATRQAEPP
jgi:quercetin dioxygenase-like cupin family protein